MNATCESIVCTGMTDTKIFTPADALTFKEVGAPSIAGTGMAFTPHRYNQDDVAANSPR
jgi:hypothetical protein